MCWRLGLWAGYTALSAAAIAGSRRTDLTRRWRWYRAYLVGLPLFVVVTAVVASAALGSLDAAEGSAVCCGVANPAWMVVAVRSLARQGTAP